MYRYQPLEPDSEADCGVLARSRSPGRGCGASCRNLRGVLAGETVYKTTFSLILGQILADRGTTLYVNLEDCSGLEALAGASGEETLSDVLYCHRVAQPKRKLRSVVQNLGKLAYLPPAGLPRGYPGDRSGRDGAGDL